jgi:hypothetical protein
MELWLPNIVKKKIIEDDISEWLTTKGAQPYQHLIQQRIYSLYPQLHSHQTLYIAHVDNKTLVVETPLEKDGKPYKIEKCNICHEEDNVVRTTLPCNHSFHVHCIATWFRRNTSCPLCRLSCNNIYN